MRNTKIKLILCDLGNVLVKFDHRIAVRKIQPFCEKKFGEIYQLFFDSPLTKDFEEGKITSQDFYKALRILLGMKKLSFSRFKGMWNEIFFDNRGIVALLEALKKNYRLYMISNINEMHYGYIAEKFPRHLGVFDKIYLSYEVGRRKPHLAIYRKAIREAGVRPQEVLYIDDRADLIREAKKIGLSAVIFKNIGDLKKQLKNKGVDL